MVAEKFLLFSFLPSAALISRLNKSFNGILHSGFFDVVPTASNTGGIQTAGSWKGSNSTIVGVQSGGGAAWQCLVVPKMHTHRVLPLSCSPTLLEHLSQWWGCWRGQQGDGRVQWALAAQRDRLSACWRVAAGRNDSDTCALALLKWVFMWHSGPCSVCCTNVSICKKVGKEKVTAKTQGAGSCCHCCVHETLSSGGILGMYGSCRFFCWELVPNVAKPSGLVAGNCEWALPIQKLQPRNGWMTGVGKAGGKATWWSWAPFLDRKWYLCITQAICECNISLCSRRCWGVQL